MAPFHSLLVGIDLSQSDPPGSNHLSPPVVAAISTALWLAEKTKAELTFFTAVDVPLDTPYLHLVVDDPSNLPLSLAESARETLAHLVRDARVKGIAARAEVAQGNGWTEVIRQVIEHQHNLVIVGSRNIPGFERLLLGSTAQKLLRNCPCPVWITRPDRGTYLSNILLASDLHPVSEKALSLVASLAASTAAKVHVVHAIDYPLDRIWVAKLDAGTEKYHQRVRTDARETLQWQVDKLGDVGSSITVEIVDGVLGADMAILRYIENHKIDLLAMGTVGRCGLSGAFIGNTAERLLHELPCSILAVKPDDFECPLTIAITDAARN